MSINADRLAAIDVHVHLEHPGDSDTQDAAKKYFKDAGVPRDAAGLAEYYRSRNMSSAWKLDVMHGAPPVASASAMTARASSARSPWL